MAVVTIQSEWAKSGQVITPHSPYTTIGIQSLITTNSDDSVGSVYDFGLFPADALMHYGASLIAVDDLGTSTVPILEFGLFGVDGNLSSLGYSDDQDAFKTITANTTGNLTRSIFQDFDDAGKPLWQLISGVSLSSPVKGALRLKATVTSAAIDTAGDILVSLSYGVK